MSNENVVVDEIRAALERDPRIPHPVEVAVAENEAPSPCVAPFEALSSVARWPGSRDRRAACGSFRMSYEWTRVIAGWTTRSAASPSRR